MSLLQDINQQYLALHVAKEDAFWAAKMHLQTYGPGDFEMKEVALKRFITDSSWLPRIREALIQGGLSNDERVGLEGWRHFFEVNAMENGEAKRLQEKLVEMEGELERQRGGMALGYCDPETNEFVSAGSDKLRLTMVTAKDDRLRRAAWVGLQSIEPFVLNHEFLEIVKERNRLGRLLGYEDYYDYKLNLNEGMTKRKLFELLGELERETREVCFQRVESVLDEHGSVAKEPWNFDYLIAGDLTAKNDPYFPFEDALMRWGKSFAALGITYEGAELTLDLLFREGKYENGFMHGPFPAYIQGTEFLPARINFTANAIPDQIGSGYKALTTLFHEGGHAAHFSNIKMPAPCFSQEFAPSSIAFAETQSMFLDRLADDPDWRLRYAHTHNRREMPLDLIRETVLREHQMMAYRLRSMLVVPFAEKAIYEMSSSDLTPETVLACLRDIERSILFLNASPRPVLSVPHLLSGEASAYYHAYVLATMAVFHTRSYFLKKDGHIVDNPEVGRLLTEKYWRPGNSKSFLQLIEELTGNPFSAKATVDLVNRTDDETLEEVDKMIAVERKIPRHAGPPDLEAVINIVHGDSVIAATRNGDSFQAISDKFAAWVSDNTF